MTTLPEYLKQDECFIYCPKEHVTDLYQLEGFIPFYKLLQGLFEEGYEYTDNVRKSYFNIIGDINGKRVIII